MAVITGVAVTVAAVAEVGGVGGVGWGLWVIIAVASERLGARLTTRCQLLGSIGSFRALRRRKILNVNAFFAFSCGEAVPWKKAAKASGALWSMRFSSNLWSSAFTA